MCLIAVAHLASERFPLVIAANRDEDYARPTLAAAPWDEDNDVVGGRDVLHRGSWLAVTASGRFAAVTNLRGARPPAGGRSRGLLVSDFVLSKIPAAAYAAEVSTIAGEYAGFHLIAGEISGEVVHLSRGATLLDRGVHGLSNSGPGERWPKVDAAVLRVRRAMEASGADPVIDDLLAFLSTSTGSGAVESEPFIATERYGTRCSTVVVATADEIVFCEQSYRTGGVRDGELRRIVLERR